MTSKQLEQVNIKIAKKLGWTRFRKERLPEPLQKELRMTGLAPGNQRNQFIPFYTNNLAYAMQLVDWANEHLFHFNIYREASAKIYNAKFSYPIWEERNSLIGRYQDYEGQGTLPSVAICMAFLKIKQVII